MSKTTKQILVGIPLILLLLAIAIPNFVKSRETLSTNACANNLKWIDSAKKQWAIEKQKTTNDVPTWDDLTPYIAGHSTPDCPSKGVYTIGRIGVPPTCSIGGEGHTLPSD